MNNYLAAIDFGSTKIVTIVGEKYDSGVKIVFCKDVPLPEGVIPGIDSGEIINDGAVTQLLLPLIKEAGEAIGEKIDEAIVSVSGKVIESDTITVKTQRSDSMSHITNDELSAIANNVLAKENQNDKRVFDIIPQDYNVDDYIGYSHIIGMKGSNIESTFKLFTGKKSLISTRADVLQQLGIKLRGAILSPIASARATLNEIEMENGVALVDIGGGTTDIAIIKDNIVREIAIIPFGGESITSDIKQIASITHSWAELVKIRHGFCIEEDTPENKKLILKSDVGDNEGEIEIKTLSQIIEARMSEIFEAVRYVIEQSGYLNKIPSGVVLTGGGCYMESIIDLAKIFLKCKVRLAAPRTSITSDSDDNSFDAYSSTAVGLILEGFEKKLSNIGFSTLAPSQPQQEPLSGINKNIFGENIHDEDDKVTNNKDYSTANNKVKEKSSKKKTTTFFGNLFSEENNKA